MSTAEKLRPIAVATCMEVIGHDEGTIIAAATKCISKYILDENHFLILSLERLKLAQIWFLHNNQHWKLIIMQKSDLS